MLGYTWHWRKTIAKTANIKYIYTLIEFIDSSIHFITVLFSFLVFKGFQWIKKLIGHKIFHLDLSAKKTQNSFLRTSVYRSRLLLCLFLKDFALGIFLFKKPTTKPTVGRFCCGWVLKLAFVCFFRPIRHVESPSELVGPSDHSDWLFRWWTSAQERRRMHMLFDGRVSSFGLVC